MANKLFLSHSSKDKQTAQELRRALEDRGVAVWEDSLELRAGDKLSEIEAQVKAARGLLLLWTPAANESEWVRREVAWALEAEEAGAGYAMLVLLRGSGQVSATALLGEERVFIPADDAIEDAVPKILEALGEIAPSGRAAEPPAQPPPLEELVISFIDLKVDEAEGKSRAAGRCRVEHDPAEGTGSRSGWHDFESPLGPIELEEIRWYLERYPGWPFGVFRKRASELEEKLPEWGRELYERTLGRCGDLVTAWKKASGHARRIVVEVDDPGGETGDKKIDEERKRAGAGAAALLALPWELLSDEKGYLFEGGLKARVVRRIPRRTSEDPLPVADTLRVLLVIARPEEEGVSFIDPRASAVPLIEALAPLGHRAELEVLTDGTLPALRDALAAADRAGQPFHVVHFDGHGVYDQQKGLGKLCFENPADAKANKEKRRTELVGADQLGALLRERRVPLFVLEACQTAMTEQEVTASVAARLLAAGVGSVLAMTHAVLVETARRFIGRFYTALADGKRIGTAMVEAQVHLLGDPVRGNVGGHGELTMQDWFVPVLFQEEDGDLQLLHAGAKLSEEHLAAERQVREGALPPPPPHGFVGRSRQLLALQRTLRDERTLTLLAPGGQGKTALAIECARWLLGIRRFERVAFASVEDLPDARILLDRLGRQLVPGYSVAAEEGTGEPEEKMQRARLPVERVLKERRVLLVVDNFESLLAAPGQEEAPGLQELLDLLHELAQLGDTRLLLTSREALPAPLDGKTQWLDRLSKSEGRELVAGVLARLGVAPAKEEQVDGEENWIDRLIETVNGHARSLVLLTPRIAERGLKVTAERVAEIIGDLEKQHPGERELSLLASVRLSLDRLPEKERRQARALAVFHGTAHVEVLAHVLEVEPDEALTLSRQLVALGLAAAHGPYLFPDPALGPALADGLGEEELRGMEERWLAATLGLIGFLYQQLSQDAQVAVEGTALALRDLLAAVAAAERRVEEGGLPAEQAMHAVTSLEQLVEPLGRPAVLRHVAETRRRLDSHLPEWSHARFISERAEVELCLAAGDAVGTLEAATRLRDRAAAAVDAYPGASYDEALSWWLLSRAQRINGGAQVALTTNYEAERRFDRLAETGGGEAQRMLSAVLADRGDALRDLGRLEEATAAYQRSIENAEETSYRRGTAVGRFQLGTVLLLQGRLGDALKAYERARQEFERLGESGSVAGAWHQIGMVHQKARKWDLAEDAYQRSLRIKTDQGNLAGQASTLNQLGAIYRGAGKLEEAARFFRLSMEAYERLGDRLQLSRSLGNLARVLLDLDRLAEARERALVATELDMSFDHAAEPWKTQGLLHDIETRAGNPDAARAARTRAFDLYLAYRRDGGEPRFATGRLVLAVGKLLHSEGAEAARRLVPPPEQFAERYLPLREALLAIIDGSRDPALAEDSRLSYADAVELALLLESLS